MIDRAFFSRSAMGAIGIMLLAVAALAIWMIGPTAIQRWFG